MFRAGSKFIAVLTASGALAALPSAAGGFTFHPFKIALSRVKPKDKDSGDVERFRLRQVTNRDGRAVALDRLTLRLQTLPRREGYWLDTGMLKTG